MHTFASIQLYILKKIKFDWIGFERHGLRFSFIFIFTLLNNFFGAET